MKLFMLIIEWLFSKERTDEAEKFQSLFYEREERKKFLRLMSDTFIEQTA